MFNINDRVVCIDDSPGIFTGATDLKKGETYVVELVGISVEDGEETLMLVGVPVHFNVKALRPVGWGARRFIPKAGSQARVAVEKAVDSWAEEQVDKLSKP